MATATKNMLEINLNLPPENQKLETKTSTTGGHNRSNNNRNCNNNKFGNHLNKRKNKHDRSARKRSKSFSGCGIPVEPKPVLPSKFLLGGNINDPLNLNSLQDEEINRAMNAFTPKSSPLPTPPRRKGPIEVIIRPNMADPLHLIDCENDAEYEQTLSHSPVKKGRKKRINKKRRTISGSAEGCDADISGKAEARTPELVSDSARVPDDPVYLDSIIMKKPKACKNLSIDLDPKECDPKPEKSEKITKKERSKRKSEEGPPHSHLKKFKNISMDKIVSPVIPQPGAWLKRANSVNKKTKPRQNLPPCSTNLPQFKEKNKKYQYGNYNRYYGYRNPNNEIDYRLKLFCHHQNLFANKDILDIGCNIGHITLSVARDFGAKSVLGIDIDPQLISIARKNVKHYVKTTQNSPRPEFSSQGETPTKCVGDDKSGLKKGARGDEKHINRFHDTRQEKGRGFPYNVVFKQCNYVPEDESLLALEQPQYDTILCLSITKWIHLNWGDEGVKLAFRRMYEQLRPGGKLLLEPQYWASYKSKRKLTETIYKNYHAIEFFPEKFTEYLLSPAVGFAKSEILGYPHHKATGFRRPIQAFTKSTMFPSERLTTSSYHGQTDKYEFRTSSDRIEHVYATVIPTKYCPLSPSSERIISSERLSETEDPNIVPTKYCPSLEIGENASEIQKRLGQIQTNDTVQTLAVTSKECLNLKKPDQNECKNCKVNPKVAVCECQNDRQDSMVDET